jgi:hypothetical protein
MDRARPSEVSFRPPLTSVASFGSAAGHAPQPPVWACWTPIQWPVPERSHGARSYRPAAEIQAVVAARLRPDGRRRVDGRDRASGLTRTEYWLPDGTAAALTALSNTVRTMRRVCLADVIHRRGDQRCPTGPRGLLEPDAVKVARPVRSRSPTVRGRPRVIAVGGGRGVDRCFSSCRVLVAVSAAPIGASYRRQHSEVR